MIRAVLEYLEGKITNKQKIVILNGLAILYRKGSADKSFDEFFRSVMVAARAWDISFRAALARTLLKARIQVILGR